MRIVKWLAFLSLSLVLFNANANANDMESAENDYKIYCTEQAEISGIEDAAEKESYVKECIESFIMPSGDAPEKNQ